MTSLGVQKTWYDKWREAYDLNLQFLEELLQYDYPENKAMIKHAQDTKKFLLLALKYAEKRGRSES